MTDKSTILIVDDDPDPRKILSDIFKAKGIMPIAVETGKAALKIAKDEMPAVALIDLKLEDMSGLEVMKEIKKRSPCTECIVLTGYASKESAIEATNLGAYGYLEKPYDIDQLLVTIKRSIEKQKTEKELKKHREHLEELVKERTAELQKTINLMSGREVRMAGLKKTIKKLRAQLKEAGMTPVADDPIRKA